MLKPILGALALALSTSFALAQDKPTLNVYSYESFVGEYGPGQALKKAFEAECDCVIAFSSAEDGAALYSKLKLEGPSTKADVVVGLDDNLMGEAQASGLFAPHEMAAEALNPPRPRTSKSVPPHERGDFALPFQYTTLP